VHLLYMLGIAYYLSVMRYGLLLLVLCSFGASAQHIHFNLVAGDQGHGSNSFRGLSVVDDQVAWVSGTKGSVMRTTDGGLHWQYRAVPHTDSCDFRSIYAIDGQTAIVANAGTPGHVFRTTDGGRTWAEVYTNHDAAMFIDGISFWNNTDGIIYGDPIHGHMFLLRTHDGGQTWQEVPATDAPQLQDGEASFAASGTAIRCVGKYTVIIATGGKVSRLWVSDDRGRHWKVHGTPIIQGSAARGIFSMACKDAKHIVIVGGDYEHSDLKSDNVFCTADGGLTWSRPATGIGGYRECAEYIGRGTILCLSQSGEDISYDDGLNWQAVPGADLFHVVRNARHGKLVIAAGAMGRIAIVEGK
jgi:photosystem II stability/assembly factor-like uncharacterized protein